MRRDRALSRFNALETLEMKLMPTSQSLSGLVGASVISTLNSVQADDDDPPPAPDPTPSPYPGDGPTGPILPPVGPDGPGS
jgi:hypothetical protein